MFKICILAAGKGSRVTKYGNLHKALLPLSNRPAISWILKTIDPHVPIVIALGYKSEQIQTYLKYVYPDRNFEFVIVDNYENEGSGPGYSLFCCKSNLNCPFIVTAVDTIVMEKLEEPVDNWIGVKKVSNVAPYCLYSKQLGFYYNPEDHDALAFIGMGGVVDYNDFWINLSNKYVIKHEHQMTNGFENLSNLNMKEFNWFDVGNNEAYSSACLSFKEPIVAEKENETLYIEQGKVVKFFADADKVSKRVNRTKLFNNIFPEVAYLSSNMYGYKYLDGHKLSETNDLNEIDCFFNFCKQFFSTNVSKDSEFDKNCHKMYHDKTYERINDPDIVSLLNKINWDNIVAKAIPYKFHGDFQAENIILNNGKIMLIDWRDCFGTSEIYGDLYYDLGKLYHSLLIINADPEKPYDLIPNVLTTKFKEFCFIMEFDWSHIELLGCIQYMTIANLYKDPRWVKFYSMLGKHKLIEWLNKCTQN